MIRCFFPVLLLLSACAYPAEVPPVYFIALTNVSPLLAREGGQRPTTPANFAYRYDPALRRIHFTWDPSVDPDFQVPVGLYKLYVYLNGPPLEYYRPEDLYGDTPVHYLDRSADDFFLGLPFSGSLFFVVTGFDGGTESLPSNLLRVDLTNR